MTHNLIKTENYLLVVDDSDIKVGDYFIPISGEGWKINLPMIADSHGGYNNIHCKKIISYRPLNNAPYLNGVPVLPLLNQEDDVKNLAAIIWGNVNRAGMLGFIDGYNKAKEKYKYTEDDLKIVINMARKFPYIKKGEVKFDTPIEKIIQSLQQPKLPIAFECETERLFKHNEHMEREFYDAPKTITNSEGMIEWVGKYIYNKIKNNETQLG
jgi:hypothetical protein